MGLFSYNFKSKEGKKYNTTKSSASYRPSPSKKKRRKTSFSYKKPQQKGFNSKGYWSDVNDQWR